LGILIAVALMALVGSPVYGQTGADPARPQELSGKEKERISGVDLFDMHPQKDRFRIIHGKGKGEAIAMRLEPYAEPGNKWRLVFADLYRLMLVKAPDGAVNIEQLEICRKDRKITFSPSFPLLPAQLVAGKKIRTSGTMKLKGLGDNKEAKSGRYTHVVKSLSRTELDTPAGTRAGYLLEYTCRIELPYSRIRIDLETGFDGRKRLVYWREQTTVEKFGLFSETSFRTLAAAPKKPAEKPGPPSAPDGGEELNPE
ncbi:MAG TPA: hypothetical protein VKO20_02550, partial [Desulfosalsimonadaceae bacterium]|nr:hypothetical protein [Desulfosalsimonadaceae bacterium]